MISLGQCWHWSYNLLEPNPLLILLLLVVLVSHNLCIILRRREWRLQACHFTTTFPSYLTVCSRIANTDKWNVYLLFFFFLIHIEGTFSNMTQLEQAKTASYFLFRNFALLKRNSTKILTSSWTRNRWVTGPQDLEPQDQWPSLPDVKLVNFPWGTDFKPGLQVVITRTF